jgi:CRP/FNR family transcriptional regulator
LFYETLAPSVLSVVHKSTFKEVIENDPAYMCITINILLHYYRVFQERIQNLELTTVRERVAFRLLFLGKYLGQANGAEITLAVPITDEELADSINTSRETANRVLSQLIAEGYLRKQGRELVIVDPQGLHAIDGEFEALDN